MRATGLGGLGLVLAALALLEGLAEPLGSRADAGRKWWETAVVYQVYPRSFKDSNGDGVGDLPGITSKLEYLRDLGVGAVWLSPIFPSPQKDFGYDISDFVGIDPQYGTMDDFDALLKRAHELGLKVVLDYVPNHSSDQHEWFQKSVKKEGKYTDYYVWHDAKIVNGVRQPPTNWISNFRGSAWKWNEERQQYYLHQFVDEQPDLNFRSQDVVAEMKEVIRFWLRKGVDGIRVDTIISLFEDTVEFRDEPVNEGGETDPEEHGYLNHIYTENLPETYDMVQQWREVLEEFDDQRVMMTEAYATLEQTMAYYGTEERPGASFSFNFYLITKLSVSSKATDFKQVIDDWMGQMNDFRKPNWVIGNHDQFRVGSFFRYGAELADGIHMISLMLPGTAMTYNGEEIDMDNTYITWEQTKDPQAVNTGSKNYLMRSRDLARTPFQWDDTTSAGFSTSKSTWLPVNPNYWRLNLKKQMNDEHSHFKIYKALMEARKKPAVQSSSYKASTIGSDVLIIARELSGEDSFYSVINFGSEENVVDLSAITAESSNTFDKLYVWTSSINSILRPGNTVTASLTLRPKEAVVLTTSVSAATRSALSATLFAVLIVLGVRA